MADVWTQERNDIKAQPEHDENIGGCVSSAGVHNLDGSVNLDNPNGVFIEWRKPERPSPLDYMDAAEFHTALAEHSHDMVEWIGENENERDRLIMAVMRDREENMIVANIDAMNHFNDVYRRKPDEDLAWLGDGSLALKRRDWIHDMNDALVALRVANDEEVKLAP